MIGGEIKMSKVTKLCLSRWDSVNDVNPRTRASTLFNLFIPKKGFLDTPVSWSIRVFLVAVAVVSPRY